MFILPRCICFVVLISIVSCLIQDEPMPREFHECFLNQTSGRDITTMPSYSVQVHCLNYYWTKTHQDRFHTNIDPSVLNWIQTLDRNLNLRRQKRQARGEPLRRRREIRTLSDRERQAFFNAIVALKEDTVCFWVTFLLMFDYMCLLRITTPLPRGKGVVILSKHV